MKRRPYTQAETDELRALAASRKPGEMDKWAVDHDRSLNSVRSRICILRGRAMTYEERKPFHAGNGRPRKS